MKIFFTIMLKWKRGQIISKKDENVEILSNVKIKG